MFFFFTFCPQLCGSQQVYVKVWRHRVACQGSVRWCLQSKRKTAGKVFCCKDCPLWNVGMRLLYSIIQSTLTLLNYSFFKWSFWSGKLFERLTHYQTSTTIISSGTLRLGWRIQNTRGILNPLTARLRVQLVTALPSKSHAFSFFFNIYFIMISWCN